MILSSVSPEKHVVFLAVPHPASRRTFAFLQAVLAVCPERIMCALATSFEEADQAAGVFIYLRPGAADVLDLAHAADTALTAAADQAYALVGRLDRRWRHFNLISLEHLLARPDQVLRTVSRLIDVPFGDGVYAAADEQIGALREDVACFGHPLAFLAAVETRPPVTKSDEARRRWLIITGDQNSLAEVPDTGAQDRVLTEMQLDGALDERLQAMREPQAVVHLHNIHGTLADLPLLDWVLPRLAAGGRLSGHESSEAEAERVMSRLTRSNGLRGFVFNLAGRDWHAIPFVERS